MSAKTDNNNKCYCNISDDPKDLIRRFLVVEPSERIELKDSLEHPFFNTVVSFLSSDSSFKYIFIFFSIQSNS